MLKFDWTISLGNLVTAVSIVLGLIWAAFKVTSIVVSELSEFRAVLKGHTETLVRHDALLHTYEVRVFDLVSDLQRLIGRFDVLEKILERRNS